jgi:hypothetical protein
MIFPSVEFTIQDAEPEERTAGVVELTAVERREAGSSPSPLAREHASTTPVCAACWAY